MHNITIKKFFLAILGLNFFLFCVWDFSSCSEQGLLLVVLCRVSHCSGFSFGAWNLGFWASVAAAHRLSTCGSQALDHRLLSNGAWA